jgi:hypothetical protein
MYKKPHIDLHGILQTKTEGDKFLEADNLMSKGEEKEQNKKRKYQRHENKGSIPKESSPFPSMSKGERNMRRGT